MVHPIVTVVLPVYNCARYVAAAVRSILDQTISEFELIVIDDGSTDETPHVLAGFSDPRLNIVRQPNRGLAASLNRGIGLAKGRYIARQDADDIALPTRLQKQLSYLDAHPHCGLLGTWTRIMVNVSPTERGHRHPAQGAELKFMLLFDSRFVHSSVMLRKSVLDRIGPYSTDPARQPPEDFELWSRIAREFDVANLPEVLQIYREIPTSISRTRELFMRERTARICAENLAWAAGRAQDDPHARDVAAAVHRVPEMLSSRPSPFEMSAVIDDAAARIAKSCGADVEEIQECRENMIRIACSSESRLFSSRIIRAIRGLARHTFGAPR